MTTETKTNITCKLCERGELRAEEYLVLGKGGSTVSSILSIFSVLSFIGFVAALIVFATSTSPVGKTVALYIGIPMIITGLLEYGFSRIFDLRRLQYYCVRCEASTPIRVNCK